MCTVHDVYIHNMPEIISDTFLFTENITVKISTKDDCNHQVERCDFVTWCFVSGLDCDFLLPTSPADFLHGHISHQEADEQGC